eukprot:TRINITY_DN26750_c0_g2_i1.p1 TRINITY_DN26750_c0_g2~~TRINITY_DN26750_c0_g2_i1.p1  ORF type:complete len:539 (-),score=72.03 TRINITY_DN26750_c0_g2_i1:186-1634(-)
MARGAESQPVDFKLGETLDNATRRRLPVDFIMSLMSRFTSSFARLKRSKETRKPSDDAWERAASESNLSKESLRSLMKKCSNLTEVLVKWIIGAAKDAVDGKLKDLSARIRNQTDTHSPNKFLQSVWRVMREYIETGEAKSMLMEMQEDLRQAIDLCSDPDRSPDPPAENGGNENVTDSSGSTSLLALSDQFGASASTRFIDEMFEEYMPDVIPPFLKKILVPQIWKMFQACVVVDLVGLGSAIGWVPPPFGQLIALVWSLVAQPLWLNAMFDGSKKLMFFGFLDNLWFKFDVIPVSSLAWFFSYWNTPLSPPVRKVMSLPDRSVIGSRSCQLSVLTRIKRDYQIMKDNQEGHLYLKCKGLFNYRWAKASCLDDDCGGLGGFCFVANKCGSAAKPCQELKDQDPLKCSENTARLALERRTEKKRVGNDDSAQAKIRRQAALARSKKGPKRKGVGQRKGAGQRKGDAYAPGNIRQTGRYDRFM